MQLQLDVPDDLAEVLRKRAESRGISVSRYLVEIVRREVRGARPDGWPSGFFEDVVGKWNGELERPDQDDPERREPL